MSPAWVPRPPTLGRGRASRYDAVVVGTGVGGSVTAGLLAARGAKVLVLEKNEALGGSLASHTREGFKFDLGSHLVSQGAHGPLGAALARAGLDRPRFLTHRTPLRARGMVDLVAPTRRRGLPAVALEAARQFHLSGLERARLARMLFQMFTLTEWELRRWDRRSLDEFVRAHSENAGFYLMMGALTGVFFVLPPWDISAGEAIRAFRDLLERYSLSYVEGGMDAVPHALLGKVVQAGGDVVTGARVTKIRARGEGLQVATEDGAEYAAPVVACNLAPADLLLMLDAEVPPAYRERVAGLRGSGSAHQLRLALRRPLVEEGCVVAGVSLSGKTIADLDFATMRGTIASVAEGRVTDPLAVYAPVPTNFDPSLAPEGRQLLVASIYGPVRSDPADPPERWRERAMAALAQVVPHLEDELLFSEFLPIPALAGWMGKSNRGAICTAQLPGQVGRDRLPVATPVPGLYLVGDGAGGRGIGVELAASSAMEAVDALARR